MARKKLEELKVLEFGDNLLAVEPLTVPIRVIIGKKKLFGEETKSNVKNLCLLDDVSIVVKMQIPETDYTEHSISRNVYCKFRELEDNEKQMIIGNVSAMITSMYKAVEESSMNNACRRMWNYKLGRLKDMNIRAMNIKPKIYDMAGYLEMVANVLVQLSHDLVIKKWVMCGNVFDYYNFTGLIQEIDNSKELLSIDLTNEDYDFDNEQERLEVINDYVYGNLMDKIFTHYAYRYYILYWFNRIIKTKEVLV